MVVKVTNKEFGNNKHIEFCYATVVKSGNNVPCVDPELVTTGWSTQGDNDG